MFPTLVKPESKRAGAIPLLGARVAGDEGVLVDAARNGNELAFETLVKRHQKRILLIAKRYTRTRHDAEDVVQQSLQKAFLHLRMFEGKSSFSTWLTRIAINEAMMFLRKGRAHREISIDEDPNDLEGAAPRPEIPDLDPDPEACYLRREEARILHTALEDLKPGLRRAIELRELTELSTKETARSLGLSVAAVKARVFRGRKQLRRALRRYMKSARMLRNETPGISNQTRTSRGTLRAHALRALLPQSKAAY